MRVGCRLGLSLLAGASLLSPILARAQQNVKSADAACAACHAGICRTYLATPKANASGLASDHLISGELTHGPSGVRYSLLRDDAQIGKPAVLRFEQAGGARTNAGTGIKGQHRLDYFLGSGHLGVTYLYTQEGYLLESPVAWYASTGTYDMKPGFGKLAEMPPALPMEPACLRCHMSGVAHALPGTINRYAGPAFQQTGITCESCHGDSSEHVRSRGKAAVLNPAKLDPDRRDAVCISCHLEGDVSVERAGRSALDYKPGDRIGDYVSYFIFASKDPLSRGVSEVEQLSASQCKRVSGDRMACTSCHDPHFSPAPEQRVAFYRGKCLACHSEPAFARTHHPEQPDCTSCHMPRSAARNIPHVAWTDHRILAQPAVSPLAASQAGKDGLAEGIGDGTLTAIFSPQASERDRALALYEAVSRGKSHDREQSLTLLKQVDSSNAHDPRVLEALGVLAGLGGDAAASEKYLRELLVIEPMNLTGIADLGVLLARQGKFEDAVELWKPAFARNEDLIGLARNLAAAECALADQAGARSTIESAQRFSPGVRAIWNYACRR